MIFNIWPDRRKVNSAQMITWAKDAIDNGRLNKDEVYGSFTLEQAIKNQDAFTCATALHREGLITLASSQSTGG